MKGQGHDYDLLGVHLYLPNALMPVDLELPLDCSVSCNAAAQKVFDHGSAKLEVVDAECVFS